MKERITNIITDRSSSTINVIFDEARKVLNHDYRGTRQGEIDERNSEFLSIIKEGGLDGKRAMEKLTKLNYLLVVSVANQYSWAGMELIDLVQEGILGVVNAVERYDEAKGQSFGAFAKEFIRCKILNAINRTGKTISIPSEKMGMICKYNKYAEKYQLPPEDNNTIIRFLNEEGIATDGNDGERKVLDFQKALNASGRTVSYDAQIGSGDDGEAVSMGQFFESEERTDESAERGSLRWVLLRRMKSVLSRESYEVMYSYFGFDGGTYSRDKLMSKHGMSEGELDCCIRNSKMLLRLKDSARRRELQNEL